MDEKQRSGFRGVKSAYFSRHINSGCVVRGEVWLEKDGKLYVDIKRAILLNLINKLGSISAAARSIKVTYNTAWLWVMAMNRLSPCPLVKRGAGGANGGYSILTAQGHKVIAEYNKLNNSLKETINQFINFELNMEMNSPKRTSVNNVEVANNALI
jgi:molybdate transport system regulatory protein